MVKHIVMWKIKDSFDGMNKEALAAELKKQLLSLEGVIPELKEIEVGVNGIHFDKNSDVVLNTVFDSYDDLATYAVHPEHVKVGGFVKNISIERACVDFEF